MRTIDQQPSMREIEEFAGRVDIVIREGFKNDGANKIEVYRSGVSGERTLCLTDTSIRALVSSEPEDVPIPHFDWNDAISIADFISTKL